jgi:hypothetical protein
MQGKVFPIDPIEAGGTGSCHVHARRVRQLARRVVHHGARRGPGRHIARDTSQARSKVLVRSGRGGSCAWTKGRGYAQCCRLETTTARARCWNTLRGRRPHDWNRPTRRRAIPVYRTRIDRCPGSRLVPTVGQATCRTGRTRRLTQEGRPSHAGRPSGD